MHRTDPTTLPLLSPIFNGQYGFRSKKLKMSEILKLSFSSFSFNYFSIYNLQNLGQLRTRKPNKDMYMKLTQTALTTVAYLRFLF